MDLKTYIQTAESVGSLARRLKIPAALMSQWHTGVRPVPIERAVQIEQITSCAIWVRVTDATGSMFAMFVPSLDIA